MEFLSQLQALLNDATGNPELAQLGFTLMVGLAIFLLMMAGFLIYQGLSSPIRRRVRQLEAGGLQSGPATAAMSDSPDSASRLLSMLAPMGDRLMPADEVVKGRTATRLRHAGFRKPGALNTYYGVKLALTLLLPTLLLFLSSLLRLPSDSTFLLVLSAGILGFVAPSFWLDRALVRRTKSIRRGLPDTLDLLVVCTEAGLGLSAAIARVARDLEISQPELSEELHLFGMQTRAGMDTRSALKDLEERSGVEEIRSLVTSLVQSMRFGTSIASTLRIYAAELRDKRTQEAEEKAAKVSTKMLFPLVFCVLPSFFVVALGPPLLGAMEAMAGR